MTAPNSEAWTQFLRDQAERQAQTEHLVATNGGMRPVPERSEHNGGNADCTAGPSDMPGR